ncbi:hypothetical protein ACA910_000851 [Epithemia clementina (nom. ined.)]
MGNCFLNAPSHLIDQADGDAKTYHQRFVEKRLIGEGQFGKVKLVHGINDDKNNLSSTTPHQSFACKILPKGPAFKHNTFYAPIKPTVLKGEIMILRKLEGQHFCLHLEAVYENPRFVFIVTELCKGGEMIQYAANRKDDLSIEDVSRIAFQLFDAINHCAIMGVIHRDIKPENCMFVDTTPTAELRLIDFGSGTLDISPDKERHTTFAGSPFYISPEMFQKTYTYKTDVWSAGVTLYVLVAGFPGDQLQEAFDILQKSRNRQLRRLPNLPEEMPSAFFGMLDQALTYRQNSRPSAGDILKSDFVQFHLVHGLSNDEDVTAASRLALQGSNRANKRGTESLSLRGSSNRHSISLDRNAFERALTKLLLERLSQAELQKLVDLLKKRVEQQKPEIGELNLVAGEESQLTEVDVENSNSVQRLPVVRVHELKSIVANDLNNRELVLAMDEMPRASLYNNCAYHITLLEEMCTETRDNLGGKRRSISRSQRNNFSLRGRATSSL